MTIVKIFYHLLYPITVQPQMQILAITMVIFVIALKIRQCYRDIEA